MKFLGLLFLGVITDGGDGGGELPCSVGLLVVPRDVSVRGLFLGIPPPHVFGGAMSIAQISQKLFDI